MAEAYDGPAMARGSTKAADVVELRFDITPELAARIDAMLMVDHHKSRGEYLVPLIERAIEAELHRATVLLRCAGINPFGSTSGGVSST